MKASKARGIRAEWPPTKKQYNTAGRRATAFLQHFRTDDRDGMNAVLTEMSDDPMGVTLMAFHLASFASMSLDQVFGAAEADRQLAITALDYAGGEG